MQHRQSNSAAAPKPCHYAENLMRFIKQCLSKLQQDAFSLKDVVNITFSLNPQVEMIERLFTFFAEYEAHRFNEIDEIVKQLTKLFNMLIDLCFFAQELIQKGQRSHVFDLLIHEQIFILTTIKKVNVLIEKIAPSFAKEINRITQLSNEALRTYNGVEIERIYLAVLAARRLKFEKAFKVLSLLKGEYFVVGGTVLNVLDEKDFHDVDVISNCHSEAVLLSAGFRKSQHVFGLYTYRSDDVKIDLMQLNVPKLDLVKNAVQRDYTICAFYMNKNGKIIAPITQSLADWQAKKLCIIADNTPKNIVRRFSSDVAVILRGLRYLVAGYTESLAVTQAMAYWNSELNFVVHPRKQLHVKALMRRYFFMFDNEQMKVFMAAINKYQLKTKLFSLPEDATLEQLKAHVYQKERRPEPVQYGYALVMWRPAQAQQQQFMPVVYDQVTPSK